MKVRKYQASEEKTILTSMIVHSGVLGKIAAEFPPGESGPFKSRWSNLVAGWCSDYYRKHRKAPGKVIQDLFVRYAQKESDEEAVKLVESFLESLSGEYEKLATQINDQWVLERAADHFEKIRLGNMAAAIEQALENHDLERAKEIRDRTKPISFSRDSWLNPFSQSSIAQTMSNLEKAHSLVQFRGDLGRFLSPHFERDSFISFAAPEKKGKSFWLQEVVWTALNQRRKVLYYVLGDMSFDQVRRRLYSRMTLKPRKLLKEPVKWPKEIKIAGKDEAGRPLGEVITELRDIQPYSISHINQAIETLKTNTAMRMFPLRLKCEGASLVSASDVERDIEKLTEQGFLPDVVVIDYADLLAPEAAAGRLDFRHQIDATWKILRRISTEYHLLMVVATQAAARSYDRWLIGKGDFSEDKRKNAHVTGMIGINQTPHEKVRGIYRLNWPFLRDGEWADNQYVWTAGNLALGCPCIRSYMG